jgi:hypothetical protein
LSSEASIGLDLSNSYLDYFTLLLVLMQWGSEITPGTRSRWQSLSERESLHRKILNERRGARLCAPTELGIAKTNIESGIINTKSLSVIFLPPTKGRGLFWLKDFQKLNSTYEWDGHPFASLKGKLLPVPYLERAGCPPHKKILSIFLFGSSLSEQYC